MQLEPCLYFLFLLFQPFAKAPYVFVTAVHPATNKHDAASVWAEDVTRYNFRACLRELKNFDGAHQYLSVVSTKLALSYAKHLKIVFRKSLAGQILLRISRLKSLTIWKINLVVVNALARVYLVHTGRLADTFIFLQRTVTSLNKRPFTKKTNNRASSHANSIPQSKCSHNKIITSLTCQNTLYHSIFNPAGFLWNIDFLKYCFLNIVDCFISP